MSESKVYLGDGVYAEADTLMVKLTTENGIETTNTIYLQPDVLEALNRFVHAWLLERQHPNNRPPMQ